MLCVACNGLIVVFVAVCCSLYVVRRLMRFGVLCVVVVAVCWVLLVVCCLVGVVCSLLCVCFWLCGACCLLLIDVCLLRYLLVPVVRSLICVGCCLVFRV